MNAPNMARAVLLICCMTRLAVAYEVQVEPTRYFQQNCSGQSFNMHWNHVVVNVYINVDSIYSVELLGTFTTTSAQQYSGVLVQTEAPSIWASWAGPFLLGTLARSGDAYYIHRRALTGSTWSQLGAWSHPGSYVSPVVLGGAFSSGWSHAVAATVVHGP
jgi:hypothetical protein